nr:receptor-like protein 47 [Arachis hypogaea]
MRTTPNSWFYFISLLCLVDLTITINLATAHYCLDHQQSLLLHLKNNLTYNQNQSKKLIHWNHVHDCCHWKGVSCNKGHVIALDLSQESISGGNFSSLFHMQFLQSLNLAYNKFISFETRSEFQNLKNLRYLNLSNAGIVGEISKNIFKLSSLQVLDLSDNQGLNGSLPQNIPYQLASLNYLNLSHTNFSGPLPQSLFNLRKLSTLDLSNCQFNGTLPNSMSNLTHLVYLDLSFNNFTGPLPSFNRSNALRIFALNHNYFSGTIPSTHFNGLANLVRVDLGDNSFDGRVPSTLFALPSLQQLILSYNRFEGPLKELPNCSSSSLEMLDLSGNNFQDSIPSSIFQLKRLLLLQLSTNKFSGTIKLDKLRNLPNLKTFDLSHNNLSVVDANVTNGQDLSSFPMLNNLLLASCKLHAFPSFLRNQSTLLYYLDLSNNQIEGTIPNWIWKLEFLMSLNLSKNFLKGMEGPFQNLGSNLFLLDLHGNQLQGPAPIFTKTIAYLDCSNNNFSSFIPADIGNQIPNIVMLYLSNNSFHGEIHESFCNMTFLRLLDLSDNRFNGEIPKCLATSDRSLRVLSLAGNELSGHVPDTFPTSCALRFLDLNGNLLDGTVPRSLTNCQNLQVLNLGKNQLIDTFPCFLKNISTLRVMILRSNKFHGHIECPSSTGNWEMLQILDLASNNFSGLLPSSLLQSWKALMHDEDRSRFGHLSFGLFDYINHIQNVGILITTVFSNADKMKFAKLHVMEPLFVVDHIVSHVMEGVYGIGRYEDSVTIVNKGQQMKLVKILIAFTSLDFSSNYFEGPIPEEIMNFKALHALNLSHNSFSGHIPSTLGNLRNLESLDLSMNSLGGEIPTELASLTFLAIMNVSYNHLVGRIPTGTQIQSFEADSFIGNEGLCGPPLTQNCSGEGGQGLSQPPSSETTNSHSSSSIDWSLLSVELGFTFGFGIFIMPLILWERWRLWYSKKVDDALYKIVPQLDFDINNRVQSAMSVVPRCVVEYNKWYVHGSLQAPPNPKTAHGTAQNPEAVAVTADGPSCSTCPSSGTPVNSKM